MSKRELIQPNKSNKSYVRRDVEGQFSKFGGMARSLAVHQRQHTEAKKSRNEDGKGD